METLWFYIVAVMIAVYVVLDGFDLGAGILHLFVARNDRERRTVLQSIGPVWDGNEVWLLTAVGATFAAFPEWYATLFSGFYLALVLMLLALILRGVAFEFRFKATGKSRRIWDYSFHFGSLVATFMQGMVLGTFVQGVTVQGRSFAGGAFDWVNAYSVMVGMALVFGYALLGATWLAMVESWRQRRRTMGHCWLRRSSSSSSEM